ncbi:mitochondrial ribosomal protein S11 [Oratosquilla oratoria]|uniref:mitochondrial ribosomal protein S11 n=1 Tax=Oratosquilla oratoria TaxID=337810 RepID=UPI003F75B2F5
MLRTIVAGTCRNAVSCTRPSLFLETAKVPVVSDFQVKLSRSRMFEPCCKIHMATTLRKALDRKEMLASMPAKDEGTQGEGVVDLDSSIRGFGEMFPDEKTPDLLFDGVRFAELPIVHVKVSKNNSLMALTDAKGKTVMIRSCGMEGFKNTRKGTNVAAQATAVSMAVRATSRGFKNVRVKVQGIGPGRGSAMKGLTMGGLSVVSITDVTPISWNSSPRPRKAKKL